MIDIDNSNYELVESDEVFTFKNENTTLGFVRFNNKGEVEYIFVNPIFRKQGFAKKLLNLVKKKQVQRSYFKNQLVPWVKNY
jgi:GNAT superfamily N-acetyltransferase